MIDAGLTNKVVLVTGANHGIGAATARAFAEQGALVFVTCFRPKQDRPSETDAPGGPGEVFYRARRAQSGDGIVHTIRMGGKQAAGWEADLSDPTAIPELFDRAERAFGSVDVLVNNAAHYEGDTFGPAAGTAANGLPMSSISPQSIDCHFAVNTRAVALMMAEFARRHIRCGKSWGRIINVSTDCASCCPTEVSYSASKHAMEAYSRSAAVELAQYGITVNTVAPGPVQTGWMSPDVEDRERRSIPLGHVGQPEDVADAIVFFASEQARWITGQLLYVGGGYVMPR